MYRHSSCYNEGYIDRPCYVTANIDQNLVTGNSFREKTVAFSGFEFNQYAKRLKRSCLQIKREWLYFLGLYWYDHQLMWLLGVEPYKKAASKLFSASYSIPNFPKLTIVSFLVFPLKQICFFPQGNEAPCHFWWLSHHHCPWMVIGGQYRLNFYIIWRIHIFGRCSWMKDRA